MDVCLFSSSIAQRAKTESYLNNINETLNLKVICRKNESKSIFLGTDRDSGKYSRLWTLFEAIVSSVTESVGPNMPDEESTSTCVPK